MRNKPHFYLPLVAASVYIPVVFLFFRMHAWFLFAIGLLLTSSLAYWYEWWQFTTPKEYAKHGSYPLFVDDTHDDINKAKAGTFIGVFIGLILYVLIGKFLMGGF